MGETADKDVAKKRSDRDEKPKEKTSNSITSKHVVLFSFLVGIISVLVYLIVVEPLMLQQDMSGNFYDNYAAGADNISRQVLDLFMSYDENLDGKLSVKEFVPIAERIQGTLGTQGSQILSTPFVEDKWDWSGEQITLNGSFKPLVLSSMTKFSSSIYPGYDKPIQGLKVWKTMAAPQATFPVSAFSIFLPPENTQVGTPWYIIEPRISIYDSTLSSNRYIPPPVRGKVSLIHRLLAMFHPRPFIYTRFGPQGTAACIQAENEKYFKIAFRIHGEFQLNTPPQFPFWFSPAQFAGTIIISRDGSHIKSFEMAVPTNKSLNVDMEWLLSSSNDKWQEEQDQEKASDGSESSEENEMNMEVDIGFLPQMELRSLSASVLKENETLNENEPSTEANSKTTDEDEITWKSEITKEKAENILVVHFYPFKKVTYHPFKEAFQVAKQQNKLVHHILLWGSGRTLRDGPLECRPIVNLLMKNFISCWSLVDELKGLTKHKDDAETARLAQIALDSYRFPVESMVMMPNGTLVTRVNANSLMNEEDEKANERELVKVLPEGFNDLTSLKYFNFLEEGLKGFGN